METIENRSKANFVATLGLTAVVFFTILLALFLAEADSYQQRLIEPAAVPSLPVVQAAAVAAATATAPATATVATSEPTAVAEAATTAEPASPAPTGMPTLSPTMVATIVATVTPSPTPVLSACGPPASWIAYTVRYGDTLFLLARNTGSTVAEIMEANCLTDTVIFHGTRIYLPSRPPVQVQCGPPQHWVQYIVRPGDTLFSLARSRGITVSQALIGNCRTSTHLVAGQQIFLPPLPATATPPPTQPPPPPPPPPDTPTSPPPTATPTIPPEITPIPTVTPTAIPPTPTPIPPTPTVIPPTPTATVEPPTSTPGPPTVEPTPTEPPPMPTETPPPEPPPEP